MIIIDNSSLLTTMQKALLAENANKTFNFGDFISLDDIIKKLKVDVIIESGTPTRSVDDYYEKAIKYWRSKYEQLYKKSQEDKSLWAECQKIEVKLWKLKVERGAHSSMRLLGLYDSQENVIKLFPEAMAKVDASKMDEYLVSTFAHEVMHAYFNRPGHEKYPYAMFVEEPLAEFGMLLYLWRIHSPYYEWALNDVRSKKNCYRYGAAIMDQFSDGDISYEKYLKEYKIPIDENEMLSNNGIAMPMGREHVIVEGQNMSVQWNSIHNIPPTYFWDAVTKTLGLNGDWRFESDCHIDDMHRNLHDVQHLYLGENYLIDDHYSCHLVDFSSVPVYVSSQNKVLTSINGIPVWKKNQLPFLCTLDDGLYELRRNGKYAIIDSQLNNVTPFKYDFIWHFDKNELCMVRMDNKYGLVNKQGEEQVPVIYDDITGEEHLYKVKLNGEEFTIDVFGNRQS